MTASANADLGRAARYIAAVNFEIVKAAARRRQRQGQGHGARLPAALAGAPVHLVQVKETGRHAPATPPGYRTARRALPRLLADLNATDPRRQAADMLATAVERVGSVKGVDLAGSDSKPGISDGGATTRIKHVERYRRAEALANRWPAEARRGAPARPPRMAMAVRRKSGNRVGIPLFAAILAVCVEGIDLYALLRRYGWSAQTANAGPLRAAILAGLDDIAEGFGLGRAEPRKRVDSA